MVFALNDPLEDLLLMKQEAVQGTKFDLREKYALGVKTSDGKRKVVGYFPDEKTASSYFQRKYKGKKATSYVRAVQVFCERDMSVLNYSEDGYVRNRIKYGYSKGRFFKAPLLY